MTSVAVTALSRRVEEFARRTATAVKLDDLYKWGRGDIHTRLQMAGFLHQEIAIRNAQLCKELQLLPFGLAETRGVSDVVRCFSSYVDRLAESPLPETAEDDERFTALLQGILEDRIQVVATLGVGVNEVRDSMGAEKYEHIRPEVDSILDRFFIKRIGLRFLLRHYIEAADLRPGVAGIIHSNVAVGRILRLTAREAQQRCLELYGTSPEVVIVGDGKGSFGQGGSSLDNAWSGLELSHDRQFTYVPIHLKVSCSVLLQNACFAVAELHGGKPDGMPPVHAFFAHGEEEVGVKISDEGGGIPRRDMPLAWSYFGGPRGSGSDACGSQPGRGWRHSAPLGKRNPHGAGLPLARLHARYYGGDLVMKSIEGFGTDAHMFLNRLGQNCENLPHGVRLSPAMRDSSVDDAASIHLTDALGAISEAEVAYLKRQLADFRARKATATATLNVDDPS